MHNVDVGIARQGALDNVYMVETRNEASREIEL